jgi:hypothetical protein
MIQLLQINMLPILYYIDVCVRFSLETKMRLAERSAGLEATHLQIGKFHGTGDITKKCL